MRARILLATASITIAAGIGLATPAGSASGTVDLSVADFNLNCSKHGILLDADVDAAPMLDADTKLGIKCPGATNIGLDI